MSVRQLKALVAKIESRPEYKSHTVLDGGRCNILVLLKSGVWFQYSYGAWKELSPQEAELTCKRNWKWYRYTQMLSK